MTNKYIKGIREYLTKKYGKVNEEWELNIQMLSDNIEIYDKCKEVIDSVGVYNYEKNKRNPMLSTIKETQGVILKQIQHLGLSPYAISKIKSMAEEDTTDDFISSLVS